LSDAPLVRTPMRPCLALKVDVDTWRGTCAGVPRLVDLLKRQAAGATFLFSLGPDHTGRAIRRVFRPGFLKKVSRTSVLEHYGLKTLLYGTLLPGPDIGRRAAGILRSVAAAGFETGVHCFDHIAWQDHVVGKDAAWTRTQMRRAQERYTEIFGQPARVHGAAGWQMNAHAFVAEAELGFAYASDTRGWQPFWPLLDAEADAAPRCPQLPTTLPTLDELLGLDGCTAANVAARLLERTAVPPPHGHVYTLHAELEGMRLAPVFAELLKGWQAQGYALVALGELAARLDPARLPRHRVVQGEIPGRSGCLALQGPPG
jgi:peptidoglycan/xylan/chitin deacetylase (PgdA/CDA1 family)